LTLRYHSLKIKGRWFDLFCASPNRLAQREPVLSPETDSGVGELSMLLRCFCSLLLVCLALPAAAQAVEPEPKTSMEWFTRASDRMNLRLPGSPAFHMTVKFHAFPGKLAEKSEFKIGGGVYEETWLSLHEWRREVTLADFHAVEKDSGGVRKMQASGDYEPSRVLMLMDALLTPIPRNFMSREFRDEGASGWKIDHVSSGALTLVRISKSHGNERGDSSTTFFFLPRGFLAIRNDAGLTTRWENDTPFGNAVVPQHLSIKAGDRDLLIADVAIEGARKVDPATFDLPGGPAEPGMTLRPFNAFEVKRPDLSEHFEWRSSNTGTVPVFSFRGVLDRHGRYRELEEILAPNENDAWMTLDHFRQAKHSPAEIDGSPCQLAMIWVSM